MILNPLDSRSASWDIWCECTRRQDYLRLAKTLIPSNTLEEDFSVGARIVLARLAEKLAENGEPTTEKLIQQLKQVNHEQISSILEDTEGAGILARWQQQATLGIRGVLLSCIEPLSELTSDSYRFSVRRWSHNDSDDTWIFVSTHSDEMDALRPLVTTWLEITAHTLTGLPSDHLRRIFFVADELTSLNNIPSLTKLMLKSKQIGACTVLGIDSYSKLAGHYDAEEINTLPRACQTWVCLRAAEIDSANWSSRLLGSHTQLKRTEVSFQGLDHKQINQHVIHTPIVTPAQVSSLPDLHGFLRFSDQYPVAKFNAVAKELPKVATGFTPRVGLPNVENVKPEVDVVNNAGSVIADPNLAEVPEKETKGTTVSEAA